MLVNNKHRKNMFPTQPLGRCATTRSRTPTITLLNSTAYTDGAFSKYGFIAQKPNKPDGPALLLLLKPVPLPGWLRRISAEHCYCTFSKVFFFTSPVNTRDRLAPPNAGRSDNLARWRYVIGGVNAAQLIVLLSLT